MEEEPRKKSKKDRKGKDKAVEAEPGLSVAERAEKVKKTLDEYKALDHEDMVSRQFLTCVFCQTYIQIGDTATRFKYTRSAPVDLGLTPVEILLATDAELNLLAPVKHIAPYRRGGMGRTGQGLGRRIRDLKSQLKRRRWGEEEEAESQEAGNNQHQRFVRQPGSGANTDEMGTKRKWGEASAPGGDSAGKPTAALANNGERGPKKRMGSKQRMKAKAALMAGEANPVAPDAIASAAPVSATAAGAIEDNEGGDGGSKKRRKKKKSSAAE